VAEPESTLKQRVAEEMKDALRAGEKVRLAALRMLSAAAKNREVELRRELTDDEFLEVVAKQVKQRTESIEAYEKGNREDLASREREEREALKTYLPEQLSEDETAALVDEAIAETGATTVKELGKVMGYVMGRAKGRVEGAVVQAKARERLTQE
jgi:uncharacterized protein YqeY